MGTPWDQQSFRESEGSAIIAQYLRSRVSQKKHGLEEPVWFEAELFSAETN